MIDFDDEALDKIFNSPNTVLNRIAWARDSGLTPDLGDIDRHVDDCRSGRFPEPKGRGTPAKYHEALNIAKMVVRAIKVEGTREKAFAAVKKDITLSTKRIERIYDEHREHAKELVRQENIVSGVAKRSDSIGVDDAVEEMATECDLPAREVRQIYEHWQLNFPKIVSRLAEFGE